MNTRKVLLISADKSLTEVIKISSLTLTKLNCQVSFEDTSDYQTALLKSKELNLNLILIDSDLESINQIELITEIRKDINSKNKKIISLNSSPVNKEEIFKAGCDSIMTKEEFRRVVNNILVF